MMVQWVTAYLAFLLFLIPLKSCVQNDDSYKASEGAPKNRLKHSSSPYLRQHADNPVNWYSWGEAPFKKAKQDSKLVIVSIGYSACHWCHVMEHKSFMDTAVAQLMNKHFVSIKVDREQRPNVDDTYMTAARLTSGKGGWPLNAIALPNGQPIVAATYFPKKKWMKFLRRMQQKWEQNPDQLRRQARRVAQGIKQQNKFFQSNDSLAKNYSLQDLYTAWDNMKNRIDFKWGGMQGQRKFPQPNSWLFLLQYHYLTGNQKALEAVNTTLQHMAKGGIHDHVGGGFARYAIDKKWKVPHFEKMLYDNGQLMELYAQAYKLTQLPLYKAVVYRMDSFIRRHMTSSNGGFYSSLNADSEGEEGKYYVWKKEALTSLLTNKEMGIFIDYFNITSPGNWEGNKNILHRTQSKSEIAKNHDITVNQLDSIIKKARRKLFIKRKKRVLPGKDTKILTEWNALMLKGYLKAYEAFGEERFLKAALNNAKFLDQHMVTDSFKIYRVFKAGKVHIEGFLDDYGFTIEAFLSLYQVTLNKKWLAKARHLMKYVVQHFYDKEEQVFYYQSHGQETVVSRKVEWKGNVIPAATSSIAKSLYLLNQYYPHRYDQYRRWSQHLLSIIKPQLIKNPGYFSNWCLLLTNFAVPPAQVAIVGNRYKQKRQHLQKEFLPHTIWMGTKKHEYLPLLKEKYIENMTRIYVCQNRVCRQPVRQVGKALQQIKDLTPKMQEGTN